MAVIKELRSLPLHEIIGAPLAAIVQAQTQAARATVEFIEKVGFIAGQKPHTELDIGALRMAEFRYEKADETGATAEFTARVPVLSLVPIPGIQVKTARISFVAKITDAVREKSLNAYQQRRALTGEKTETTSWLKPASTTLRGSLAPAAQTNTKSGQAIRGNGELRIEIELEQMPLAPGLEKLLNLMEQAISEVQNKKARPRELPAPLAAAPPKTTKIKATANARKGKGKK
jgi:hypothetical protein